MSDYTNVVTNVITPFDPRRTALLLGSLEYIAAEVVVAKVLRKIIRADNKGWLELAYVHALSLPFMGGTSAFFNENAGYVGNDADGNPVGVTTHMIDGAKGIPAVLVAQYIIASMSKGFHAPWFNMKDLLITAGSKAITRPIIGFLFKYLPQESADNLRVVEHLVRLQRNASSLKSNK